MSAEIEWTIRRAWRADLVPLSELARKTFAEAFGQSFHPSDLTAHLDARLSTSCLEKYLDEDLFLVAECEGRLIGFIQTGRANAKNYENPVEPGDQELRRVYILSGFQGRGIGRQLIDAAFREPSFTRARNIYLDVWEENLGARKLYESYGFAVVGKRAFKVQSGATTGSDLIMVRRTSVTPPT
jgi:ribosomal protein S18 acetylase RimI-like enzyme